MARKQLINLHSKTVKVPSSPVNGVEIAIGEILIQAVESKPSIYTLVTGESGTSFAEFIDKTQVQALISSVSSDVTELSGNVGTLSSETQTLKSHFEDAVDGIGYTTGSIANYIDAQGFAKDSDLQSLSSKTVYAFSGLTIDDEHSVKTYVDDEVKSERDARVSADSGLTDSIATVSTDLANATSGIGVSQNSIKNYIENQQFAKNSDLQTLSGSVNTLNTDFTNVTSGFSGQNAIKNAIDSEANARTTEDTKLNNAITALSQNYGYAVAGLDIDNTHSVKSYVDNQVSQAISSVYRVKGSVDTYEQLPTTGLTVGDVYNVVSACTVDSKWYPAGTNWVRTENAWDPLGGTIDLTPYAYATALTSEASARESADSAINNKIGGSFDENNTVAAAITSARTSADNSLKSITGTGSDYLTVTIDAVAGGAGAKSQKFSAVPVVAASIDSVESTDKKLADAYQVKSKFASINTDITNLSQAFSAESAYTYNEIAKVLTGISASGDEYVTAQASQKDNHAQSITVAADVAGALGSISATGKLADAKHVQDYVDNKYNDATSRTDTVASDLANLTNDFTAETAKTEAAINVMLTGVTGSGDDYITVSPSKSGKNGVIDVTAEVAGALGSISATGKLADAKHVQDYVNNKYNDATSRTDTVASDLAELQAIVGDNTGYTAQYTITDALAALESDAVETITVKNTNTNLITASKTGNNVEFDFDNMVVDCGEY